MDKKKEKPTKTDPASIIINVIKKPQGKTLDKGDAESPISLEEFFIRAGSSGSAEDEQTLFCVKADRSFWLGARA